MNLSCDRLVSTAYPLIKSVTEMSTVKILLSTMEEPLLVRLVEVLLPILAGLPSSPLDETLQQHDFHAQLYIKVINFIMLRGLFNYQSLQCKSALHLVQCFDRKLAIDHIFAAITKNSQPVID